MRARLRLTALWAIAIAASACGPKVDLTKGLQVLDVSTGWVDAGIVDGQNKLVPSVAFSLKNVSDQKLAVLDVNARFVRVNEPDEWDSSLVSISGSEGLPAGATTKKYTVDCKLGYKGTEPRLDMLKNSHFVDAKVQLFAKYSNVQW